MTRIRLLTVYVETQLLGKVDVRVVIFKGYSPQYERTVHTPTEVGMHIIYQNDVPPTKCSS
jgi:hypothetical protein